MQEAELLAACYRNSLDVARQHQVESVAFPCISTGIYKFPAQLAADIAVQTVQTWLQAHHVSMEVTFCCFFQRRSRNLSKLTVEYQFGGFGLTATKAVAVMQGVLRVMAWRTV
jgi:O-acetyl-ADP-ribose deacetylase (regulator of RNase III)